MSDLRESGAIEQDADVVLFIYRKYVYSKEEEEPTSLVPSSLTLGAVDLKL